MMRLFLILAALAGPLAASEAGDHAKQAAKEAGAAVKAGAESAKEAVAKAGTKVGEAAKATGQAVGAAADKAVDTVAGEAVTITKPFDAIKEHRYKHLHNKIVHFPIALGLFGALFLLLSFRYPSYKWPARVLLFFAGIGAALALPTGEALEGAFDGTSLVDVLEAHENGGKMALALIWGAFVLSFFEVTRKFFWAYALFLAFTLVMVGAFGGVLASS